MENNAAMIVDSLLSKFGTTMENLMPAIIDFGRYECKLTIRVCSYLIIMGIIFMVVSYIINRKIRCYSLEFWMDFLFITGIVMIIICVFVIILALATLNKWNNFPEIMAYKYILGCVH